MSNGAELHRNNKPKCGHSELKIEQVSWINKIRAGFAFVTIEPFFVCYILPSYISSISVHKLYSEKACRVDLNYTNEDCDNWDGNATIQTQSMVNELVTWSSHLQNCILVITILFVGAWSDINGNRKALMVVPMSGELISTIGMMLNTYFFDELPLLVTVLTTVLPTALSGGFYVLIMGSYCYLADVTSLETRTFRMGIACTIMRLCTPIAIYIREFLEKNTGYYGIFGVSAALYVLGLLYTYFMIHDIKPIKVKAPWYKKIMRFLNPGNAWSTISIAYKSRQYRVKILLVVAAYFVINGPIYGQASIFYIYLSQKYEMDTAEIVKLFNYTLLTSVCGIFLTVTLFSKYLKMHDAILGIVATSSMIMSSCICALAPTAVWLYSTLVFELIGISWIAVIRSLGTKIVAPDHIARVYSLFSLSGAITPLIYEPMFTQMYLNTINTNIPGAGYLLGAAMTAPAVFIFIALYKQLKKEEIDRVMDPHSKEFYAYENDECYITSL